MANVFKSPTSLRSILLSEIDGTFDGSLCTLRSDEGGISIIATTCATRARSLTHSRLLTNSRPFTFDLLFLLDSCLFAAATNQLTGLFKCEIVYIAVFKRSGRPAALDKAYRLKVL